MTDDSHVERRSGLGRILNRENDACCGEKQNHDDEHRNYRPRQFNLDTSVDLRGLVQLIRLPLAKPDDDKDQQAADHDEDGASDKQHEKREAVDLTGWRRDWRQSARRGLRALRQRWQSNGANQDKRGEPKSN